MWSKSLWRRSNPSGQKSALSFASLPSSPTSRCSLTQCHRIAGSNPIDDMFDSPWKRCSVSTPFGALVAEALLFLHLAVLDTFRLIPGLWTWKLLGNLNTSLMIRTPSFFDICNLFALLTLLANNGVQHARYGYSLHLCKTVVSYQPTGGGLVLYKEWTKSQGEHWLDQLLQLVLSGFQG